MSKASTLKLGAGGPLDFCSIHIFLSTSIFCRNGSLRQLLDCFTAKDLHATDIQCVVELEEKVTKNKKSCFTLVTSYKNLMKGTFGSPVPFLWKTIFDKVPACLVKGQN